MTTKTLLSWSSGKDSAWALQALRQRDDVEVVGLLTTVNQTADRVAMHAVRARLLEAQAAAVDLPLVRIDIPSPCSNDQYEAVMAQAVADAKARGVTAMAFGDLYLEDIRAYRERMLQGTGLRPLFPIWGQPTDRLAREMVDSGLQARLTCVDPEQLDPAFVGRAYDARLLDELPQGVDPCGENGEFHTFVHAGPMFRHDIPIVSGEVVERGGFWFADLLPGGSAVPTPSSTGAES